MNIHIVHDISGQKRIIQTYSTHSEYDSLFNLQLAFSTGFLWIMDDTWSRSPELLFQSPGFSRSTGDSLGHLSPKDRGHWGCGDKGTGRKHFHHTLHCRCIDHWSLCLSQNADKLCLKYHESVPSKSLPFETFWNQCNPDTAKNIARMTWIDYDHDASIC